MKLRYLFIALLLGGCGESAPPSLPAATPARPAAQATPAETPAAPSRPAAPTTPPPSAAPAAVPPPRQAAGTEPAAAPPSVAKPAGGTTPAPAGVPSVAPAASSLATAASYSGVVARDSELKEQPFIDAKTLATLKAQSTVSVVERDGGWLKVRAQGREGWVRLLNVQGSSSGGGGTDLQQVTSLATGRAGSGNVVATSGIRGLNEEELSAAKPNYRQFDQLNGYGVEAAKAQAYARRHQLAPRNVDYLAVPK